MSLEYYLNNSFEDAFRMMLYYPIIISRMESEVVNEIHPISIQKLLDYEYQGLKSYTVSQSLEGRNQLLFKFHIHQAIVNVTCNEDNLNLYLSKKLDTFKLEEGSSFNHKVDWKYVVDGIVIGMQLPIEIDVSGAETVSNEIVAETVSNEISSQAAEVSVASNETVAETASNETVADAVSNEAVVDPEPDERVCCMPIPDGYFAPEGRSYEEDGRDEEYGVFKSCLIDILHIMFSVG